MKFQIQYIPQIKYAIFYILYSERTMFVKLFCLGNMPRDWQKSKVMPIYSLIAVLQACHFMGCLKMLLHRSIKMDSSQAESNSTIDMAIKESGMVTYESERQSSVG